MPAPVSERVDEGCRDRFDVVRLWAHDDPAAALQARADEVRGIVVSGHAVGAELMRCLPHLEIVANQGVGYDGVDTAEARRRGVVVTNTPRVLDAEVADTALGLLLMTVRRLSGAERHLRQGRWPDGPFPLSPSTLSGRTLGILGLGRIGEEIARRAAAFGLRVVYHNRRPRCDVDLPYYPSLLEMAREVDTLVVVVPGGASTRHLVDGPVLEALGPHGIVVNVARGSVVDEQALIEALREGRILGAGLDVFENEPHVPEALIAMEHVVLLPHVGSASEPTRNAMGQLVVDNLVSWFDHGTALTPVPETPLPPTRFDRGV
jgi:lactate dehydrogenase-like 2-hydroxyacid dehydrogenase